jgi:NAD+ synthase
MLDTMGAIGHITDWLHRYCKDSGQQGFVVGVSGGIDSAVTSTLCARTGLPVTCVEMPIHQAANQVDRAQEHIRRLQQQHPNVRGERVDLTPVFEALVKELPVQGDEKTVHLALANTRARLRMATLYALAGMQRALVAGTGNKVEDFGVGFYTKYGDGGVDLSPIADLTKTEVYAVAKELGVAGSILAAKPTDGLFGDDRSDEDQLGANYPELEWAMALREAGKEPEAPTERQREVLAIYDHLHRVNTHKWQPIPVCVLPKELRG